MFDKKKTSLAEKKIATPKTKKNAFVEAGLSTATKVDVLKKSKKNTTTALGNGALKLKSTGSDFVDQFGKATSYKAPRDYKDVDKDMKLLWGQNPLATICLSFYLRLVTRVVNFLDGTKTTDAQRGQGLKHEGIFRMMWVGVNYPNIFKKNIGLYVSAGSWKDIFTMLSYDLQYNGWKDRKLDWDFLGKFILAGLENPKTSSLVKKYLPQIKANSNCKTLEAQADNIIGKWLCCLLFGGKTEDNNYSNYKKYRQLKTSGNAHDWQKLISQGKFLKIDFNTIAGRALAQLVSGKFIKNNGLDKPYEKWIASKPVAKYTGYAYELFSPLGLNNNMRASHLAQYQVETMNKQFLNLIEVAKKGMKEGETGLMPVIDSSSSMFSPVQGTKVSAYSVAKTMALYFSYLLEGKFEKAYLEFSDKTIMKTWKGKSPVEELCNDTSCIVAGTNFLSVTDHFIRIKNQGVKESEFPSGIVCISDGCFNSTGNNKTNTVMFRERLMQAGFSPKYVNNFKIVLWDVPNRYYGSKPQTAFEDYADCPNLFHISGLDGASLAFLTGTNRQTSVPKTSEELFEAAMDQELMSRITV